VSKCKNYLKNKKEKERKEDQSGVQSKFQASLGNILRPHMKKEKKVKNRIGVKRLSSHEFPQEPQLLSFSCK
jgi:hypothetical protein